MFIIAQYIRMKLPGKKNSFIGFPLLAKMGQFV